MDCTLRRRWTVCYSAQVTAISIYFCTLPCTPTFALFLQREMHTQLLLFLHTFTELHKHIHMHARTNTDALHWYSVYFPLWPLFSPHLDVILGRLLTAGWLTADFTPYQIENRAQTFTLTSHAHAKGEISLYFLLVQNSKFQNFFTILFPLFHLPKSK